MPDPKNNPVDRLPDWHAALQLAQAAPRCGARNRAGNACRAPAMANPGRRRTGGPLMVGQQKMPT